ncbi:sensor histidine kinase [Actinoplanes couchii]|uniref:histidine kinase n=1 Tax=Actinoplanes couchii TaxID=403638 RepID=A0ABQ3XQP0_9ACTN|nr:HAMP domain-containing sensor histidine kinase [Actinoplanes couchii]MDR6317495.1 signal transduction histidine kinase [Actinoplanes couchii]GID60798.1 two-component sensor histidine kinase [Actinoplanes couchii]
MSGLRTRLSLFYAVVVFATGLLVIAAIALPLADMGATIPAGDPSSPDLTGTGAGAGPRQLGIGIAVAVAVLIPLSLIVGRLVAVYFLRPLRAITTTAAAISAGNLHQRLDLGEPTDELTELGAILDDLFARLQASFDAQRHFVANASHELRTPIAGQRTLLEVALADPDPDNLRMACREAIQLGEQQERLVAALLDLAVSERGLKTRGPIDLARVTERAVSSRRDLATERQITLVADLTPAVTSGDPRLMGILITNLIDNAIRHNHPGGHVVVTLKRPSEPLHRGDIPIPGLATSTMLTVTNSGPPIPADELDRLRRPFERLRPHQGFGLGLAIADAVARAHDATLVTTARPEGGLDVTVSFREKPLPPRGEDGVSAAASSSSSPRRNGGSGDRGGSGPRGRRG